MYKERSYSQECIERLQTKVKNGFYADEFDAYTVATKEEPSKLIAQNKNEGN
jgi:hypothetical protein